MLVAPKAQVADLLARAVREGADSAFAILDPPHDLGDGGLKVNHDGESFEPGTGRRGALVLRLPAEKGGNAHPGAGGFLAKTPTGKCVVPYDAIKSIRADGEYAWVYWGKEESALVRKPLKQWAAELPRPQFARVHRNSIINLAFLDRLEKLPTGRVRAYLRDAPKPIQVSLRQSPQLNRDLRAFLSGRAALPGRRRDP